MDLIYTDAEHNDIGVLLDFELDLAFGFDENNFELKMPLPAHCLNAGQYIYIENTDYGGIVDGIKVDTDADTVTYLGRTWHGIFDSKVITPASGEDYYIVSGDANTIVGTIITQFGLDSLFRASEETSPISIGSTKVKRYETAYEALESIFEDAGGKIQFTYKNGKCEVAVIKLIDYSQDEEFDSDHIEFTIERRYNTVNHLICLGQGELKDRQRIDLFADADGNISTTQTFFGIDEYVETYDYSSVESLEELEKEGRKEFKERRKDGSIDIKLDEQYRLDVGDIIGATEITTGVSVTRSISKKIVNIRDSIISVNYYTTE